MVQRTEGVKLTEPVLTRTAIQRASVPRKSRAPVTVTTDKPEDKRPKSRAKWLPRNQPKINVCTFNARSLSSEVSQTSLMEEVKLFNCDVLGISETKCHTDSHFIWKETGHELILGRKVAGKNIGNCLHQNKQSKHQT
ncbi:hypothetical protein FO519_009172 [Halicephalobus sp. NKZ332]|nr:hypothetical protein FO519_009172 [Halicephalobus sp. NKZ332]